MEVAHDVRPTGECVLQYNPRTYSCTVAYTNETWRRFMIKNMRSKQDHKSSENINLLYNDISQEVFDMIISHCSNVSNTDATYRFEREGQDGRILGFSLQRNEQKGTIYFIINVVDTTEVRLEARQRAQRQEELEAIFGSAKDMIFTTNGSYEHPIIRKVYACPHAMCDPIEGDLIGQSVLDVFDMDSSEREKLNNAIRDATKRGKMVVECQLRVNGKNRTFLFNIERLTDERLHWRCINTTPLHTLETRVSEYTTILQMLSGRYSREGICIIREPDDGGGELVIRPSILHCNPTLTRITGVSAESIQMNGGLESFFTPFTPEEEEIAQELSNSQVSRENTIEGLSKENKGVATFHKIVSHGKPRYISLESSPIIIDGQPAKICTVLDVSLTFVEQASLRARERESSNRVNAHHNLTATMSHELRTPLNAIIGFSEIMSYMLP